MQQKFKNVSIKSSGKCINFMQTYCLKISLIYFLTFAGIVVIKGFHLIYQFTRFQSFISQVKEVEGIDLL